jgi:chitin disaccharide deacetylase
MVFPNKNYPGKSITENKWKIEDVEKEFRAQIELGLKLLPSISHLSYHMGCTSLSREVKALAQKLAEEYQIPVTPDDEKFIGAGYDGEHKTPEQKRKSFAAMLVKLEPGKTYIFVDHPGINDSELQAISHIGYEDVVADRQGVTDLFTDADIKRLIKQKGIQLITYRDLVKKK